MSVSLLLNELRDSILQCKRRCQSYDEVTL